MVAREVVVTAQPLREEGALRAILRTEEDIIMPTLFVGRRGEWSVINLRVGDALCSYRNAFPETTLAAAVFLSHVMLAFGPQTSLSGVL